MGLSQSTPQEMEPMVTERTEGAMGPGTDQGTDQGQKHEADHETNDMTPSFLASVVRVAEVTPHPRSDRLDVVRVYDRTVVVPRGSFKQHDFGVYFNIGAQLPREDKYSFLESKNYQVKKIRFLGVESHGLLMNISILPSSVTATATVTVTATSDNEDTNSDSENSNSEDSSSASAASSASSDDECSTDLDRRYRHGDDVTKELGVTYSGCTTNITQCDVHLTRPTEMPLFRVDRFDHIRDLFYKDNRDLSHFEIMEDIHGDQVSYAILSTGRFSVCNNSREFSETDEKDSNTPQLHYLKESNLKARMALLSIPLVVHGVLVGPKIHDNPYNLTRTYFYILRIYLTSESRYASWSEVEFFAQNLLDERVPPSLPNCLTSQSPLGYSSLSVLARGPSELNPTVNRSGIIVSSIFGFPQFFFRIPADTAATARTINQRKAKILAAKKLAEKELEIEQKKLDGIKIRREREEKRAAEKKDEKGQQKGQRNRQITKEQEEMALQNTLLSQLDIKKNEIKGGKHGWRHLPPLSMVTRSQSFNS